MFDLFLTLVIALSVALSLTLNRPSSSIKAWWHTLATSLPSRFALALVVLRVASGCSDIQPVSRRECGNHVLESGEDCDGAEGCSNTCHFSCNARTPCPAGWGCDREAGFCRTNQGGFQPAVSLPVDDYTELRSADFDGDGRSELFVGNFPGAASVLFFTSSGELERSVSLPSATSSTIADVTDDPAHLPEVIVGGTAVSAFQSSKSRRFSPLISALARVPDSALLLSADIDCDGLRDFLLLNGNELSRVAASGALTHLAKLPISSTSVNLLRAVGRFEDASARACEMLALPGTAEGTVDIYGPSNSAGTAVALLSTIQYPAMVEPTRWMFADINGDSYDDLLISSPVPNYVSYGVGDGTFDAQATKLDREGEILAAGNVPDEPAQLFSNDGSVDGIPYADATLLNLSGDDELEVVAVGFVRRVDVLRGISSGHLSALSLPASGIPLIQDVADFDGDQERDVLLSEAPSLGDIPKTASVLFSHDANANAGPVDLAEFTSIGQMVAGYLQNDAGVTDSNADIGVLYAGQDSLEKLGFLAGGSDRLLRSELPTEPADNGYFLFDRTPVLGHFRDAQARDLVVVETLYPDSLDDPDAATKTRLALFSIGVDGTSQLQSASLDSDLIGVGAIDADGDGLDELYAAGTDSLIALRYDGATFQPAVALAEPGLGELRVQDANRDGKLDLAVTRNDELWLLIASGSSQSQKWHHFSGKTVGCSESELYYAFIQADQDPELELALGCPSSFAPGVDEPGSDTAAIDRGFADGALKICDVDLTSDVLSLAYTVPQAQNTGDFVVGDFDGDGVEDIAGQFGTLSLLRGEHR